jgi:Fe2+ or Zn2+ uptake regulation protein
MLENKLLSIDYLCEIVKQKLPRIILGTVYRNLEFTGLWPKCMENMS